MGRGGLWLLVNCVCWRSWNVHLGKGMGSQCPDSFSQSGVPGQSEGGQTGEAAGEAGPWGIAGRAWARPVGEGSLCPQRSCPAAWRA